MSVLSSSFSEAIRLNGYISAEVQSVLALGSNPTEMLKKSLVRAEDFYSKLVAIESKLVLEDEKVLYQKILQVCKLDIELERVIVKEYEENKVGSLNDRVFSSRMKKIVEDYEDYLNDMRLPGSPNFYSKFEPYQGGYKIVYQGHSYLINREEWLKHV